MFGPDPISFRRYRTLVMQLPEDSALRRAQQPDDYRQTGWNVDRELAASVIDAIGHLQETIARLWATKSSLQGFERLRMPRPMEYLPKPMSTASELQAFVSKYGGRVLVSPKAN